MTCETVRPNRLAKSLEICVVNGNSRRFFAAAVPLVGSQPSFNKGSELCRRKYPEFELDDEWGPCRDQCLGEDRDHGEWLISGTATESAFISDNEDAELWCSDSLSGEDGER